jgi:hypothetical protein
MTDELTIIFTSLYYCKCSKSLWVILTLLYMVNGNIQASVSVFSKCFLLPLLRMEILIILRQATPKIEWNKKRLGGSKPYLIDIEKMNRNGAIAFCCLSSLPLLIPATTALFGSYLSSLYSYRGCGLAYPYDWRGFVGAKKKTRVDLSVFNPI